jgi:hypothetical protein
MRILAFLFVSLVCLAETPKDVEAFFRTAGEALADQDSQSFLDHFDRSTPGFAELRDDVLILSTLKVESSIEVASDEEKDGTRTVELDWLLRVEGGRPRRQIVKCTIQKQGKKWKITSFEPVRFFKVP